MKTNNNVSVAIKKKENCSNTSESITVQEEKRRKTANMLVALVIVFFISNFPVHSLNILIHLIDYIHEDYRDSLNNFLNHSMVVAHTMCYINSTLNPFIYYIMSSTFRKQFQKLLCLRRHEENKENDVIQLAEVNSGGHTQIHTDERRNSSAASCRRASMASSSRRTSMVKQTKFLSPSPL